MSMHELIAWAGTLTLVVILAGVIALVIHAVTTTIRKGRQQ